MRIQQLSVAAAIASVDSTTAGLSVPEAERRLAEFGPNRIEAAAGEPLPLRFTREFTHFFALILWLAAALAFVAEWSAPGQGMAKIGYAIVAVIVVSGLFSFAQEFRVERTLAALRKLLPQQVEALRSGRVMRIAAEALVPAPRVMQRPPRSRRERLFDWPLALRAYLFLGLIEAAAAMGAFFFVLHGAGWGYGQALAADDPAYLRATTACLVAIVALQIVNVFLCRSATRSIAATGLGGNRWIAWGVVTEVALIAFIVYTPIGNTLFGTAPLSAAAWLFVLPFAAALLGFEELRKWLVRRTLPVAERREPV